MKRAIELAYLGLGKVSPNPMVGCVIVKDGLIIGEGWHQEFGGPHAEVNAVHTVLSRDKIAGSDVYVSLEPCSHHGKTPPCADLLIDLGVQNVYVSNLDINPVVKGKGIKKLKEASINVTINVCMEEGRMLNKRFFIYHTKKRPYIILKWAQTADRFIARKNHESKWISNEYSRQLVHKWRSEEDAIMVGANTVMYDNPRLNVRDWPGPVRQPVRIVIDPNLRIPPDRALFDGSQNTIVYNIKKTGFQSGAEWVKVQKTILLEEIMSDLYQREILSVIVEGGSHLIQSLITQGLWDEARIFISEQSFGEGIKAPDLYHAELLEKREIFRDELYIYKHKDG